MAYSLNGYSLTAYRNSEKGVGYWVIGYNLLAL